MRKLGADESRNIFFKNFAPPPKKKIGQKIFGEIDFGSKKFSVKNDVWSAKILVSKNLWSAIIFGQQKCLVKIIWVIQKTYT